MKNNEMTDTFEPDFFDSLLKEHLTESAPEGLQASIMVNVQQVAEKRSLRKVLIKYLLWTLALAIPIFIFFSEFNLLQLGEGLDHENSVYLNFFYKHFYTLAVKLYNAVLFSDKLGLYALLLFSGIVYAISNAWKGKLFSS